MDGKQIIRLCRNGHKEYYEALITRHEKPLYRYCFHLCGNPEDSGDLFQETWMKAIGKINTYDETRSFKNWLFTITTNTFRDMYRKKVRRAAKTRHFKNPDAKERAIKAVGSGVKSAEDKMIDQENLEALKAGVNRLKPHYRMVIILHYYEDLQLRDIGRILKIPEGTVKSRLNQARKILRERMKTGNEQEI